MTEKKLEKNSITLCSRFKKLGYRGIKVCLGGIVMILVSLISLDAVISYVVRDKIYTDIHQLPHREYAVVLGTAKFYAKDVINKYYQYRLVAAKELVESKKIDTLLVSGDNKTPYYNEPKTMTNDLVKMGVSAYRIKQDYAGYNTLDSTLRAKQVYQLPPFVIVSQRFHCERALFIAQYYDIDAICYVAKYPEGAYQVRIREFLARAGMVFYLLTGKQPETLEVHTSK